MRVWCNCRFRFKHLGQFTRSSDFLKTSISITLNRTRKEENKSLSGFATPSRLALNLNPFQSVCSLCSNGIDPLIFPTAEISLNSPAKELIYGNGLLNLARRRSTIRTKVMCGFRPQNLMIYSAINSIVHDGLRVYGLVPLKSWPCISPRGRPRT